MGTASGGKGAARGAVEGRRGGAIDADARGGGEAAVITRTLVCPHGVEIRSTRPGDFAPTQFIVD